MELQDTNVYLYKSGLDIIYFLQHLTVSDSMWFLLLAYKPTLHCPVSAPHHKLTTSVYTQDRYWPTVSCATATALKQPRQILAACSLDAFSSINDVSLGAFL